MKQCRTCLLREHKEELICCQCAHLAFEFRKLWKNIPMIGKHIPDYECGNYEMDKTLTGFPTHPPVDCRCSVAYSFEGDDSE